jgi:hypothetical protein
MKIDMNHHQRAFSPSEIKISSLDYTARIIAHQNAVFTYNVANVEKDLNRWFVRRPVYTT